MKCGMERFFLRSLKRVYRGKLNIFEKIPLWYMGKKDGRHGLPREEVEGEWTSPLIQRELDSCKEAHNKIYGTLQIKLEDKYKHSMELVEQIRFYEKKICECKALEPQEPADGKWCERRNGEENLSDWQVCARRKREFERRKNIYSSQLEGIRQKADEAYEELIELKSYLKQVHDEAELVCIKILCHTQCRLDFYWDVLFHARKDKMLRIPVVYERVPVPDIMELYKQMHREEEQQIEEIITSFYRDKEAA